MPLIIHGGSRVSIEQRRSLARHTAICKYDIATELRMALGRALRDSLMTDQEVFDRVSILKATHQPVADAALQLMAGLR